MTAPILKYPGAKWALSSWIVSHLPQYDHYIDPYLGSGGVYFNLTWQPRHVVLNDLSGDVTNLFQVIRTRRDELIALVEMTPWSRVEYESSCERSGDELEDARRFLVRCWQAFGTRLDKMTGWRNIGTARAATVTLWNALPDRILAVAERLKNAEIETRPALEVIARHRSPDVLIYADPPYVLSTRSGGRMYQHEMTDIEHQQLLDMLDEHPGPVALSGYACALYDDRLTHWTRLTRSAHAELASQRMEVLWLNKVATRQQQTSLFRSDT